ncbi:MAG TPA: aminotransferase class V-fold PLP-dependent enzyme [Acidimicrobiales bacterium]|nr:aminotransferase class V-fold PLP-dependent enzyme [Acidimicrobiales bacterium]
MTLDISLVGDGLLVPCLDGSDRPYINLDAAASTGALPVVAQAVTDFLPWYSSIHRGSGYKSQNATWAYEQARASILAFANRTDGDDIAIICRNTTEAINHLAYRMRFDQTDVVVTSVVEHHANLLPWGRVATRRFIECAPNGTFQIQDVCVALDMQPRPKLLSITGGSNVSGWLPPLEEIIAESHRRDIPVLVDAAQLAPHRPLPSTADFIVFSGHKMYAPFGAGALIGPRGFFREGDPFLAGGGAVELVDLNEVVWSEPPEREEAGSPNVIGAIALGAAADELSSIGFDALIRHDNEIGRHLREGITGIKGVRLLGPAPSTTTLPVASFVVDNMPHALVAARLSAEYGIGVRNGCFCAHPYLVRLLGLSRDEIDRFRADARNHIHTSLPGAVRASTGISNTHEQIDILLRAVNEITRSSTTPVPYRLDPMSGEYWPEGFARPDATHTPRSICSPG